MTLAPIIEAILRGDVGAAARLMRDLDDEIPGARDRLEILSALGARSIDPYTSAGQAVAAILGTGGTRDKP